MHSFFPRFGLALMLTLVLAACGGDDGGTKPSPVDLTGSYELMSYWEEETVSAIGPPLASGTLTMTASDYTLSIELPPAAEPSEIVDEGEYTAGENEQITLTSSGNLGDLIGIYSFDKSALKKGVLMLDVAGDLDRFVTYWRKL